MSADAPVLESARSQIAGDRLAGGSAEPAAERPQLPRHRAAGAGRRAAQHQQHAALRRDVRRAPASGLSVGSQRNLSNSFIVDGLSANDDAAGLSGLPYGVDAVEQFQVVTSGGQAELGRALGGYVNVVTQSGTNPLRGTAYGYFRDDAPQRGERAVGHARCRCRSSSTAPASAARSRATARSTSPTPSSGCSTRPADHHQRRQRRPSSTPGSPRVGYPGRAVATGLYDNPVDTLNLLGKVDHAVQRPRPAQRALQPLRRDVRELARRRRPQRAIGLGGPRQPRPGGRGQQHAHARRRARSTRRGRSSPTATCWRCRPTRRPGGEHRRRGVVRHALRRARRAGSTRCSRS